MYLPFRKLVVCIVGCFIIAPYVGAQNIGIGAPAPTQLLDVVGWVELGDETQGGGGPDTEGSIRYNTAGYPEYYDGTAWQQFGSGWAVTGNAGTNPAADYAGTSDAQALSVRTNATEAVYINLDQNVGIGTQTNDSPLHVFGTPAGTISGGTPTVQTFNITIVSNVNGVTTVTSNLTGLPTNITLAELTQVNFAGDGSFPTDEFVDLAIDGTPVGSGFTDGNDDCTFDPVTNGTPLPIDVTAIFQGNTAVTLEMTTGPLVNVGITCPGTSVEVEFVFEVTSNGGGTVITGSQALMHVESATGSGFPVVRFTDGNEQAGRVLTTDDNGYGYWADPPPLTGGADSDWTDDANGVHNSTDNIGIGTATPQQLLHIAGGEIRHEDAVSVGAIYASTDGRYAGTTGFNFLGDDGFTFELTNAESGGIHVNEDVVSIWSPGDIQLVQFFDEDGMVQRGFIDGFSGAYNATSDRRLKENITPIGNVLPRVLQLNGYRYQYIMHPDEIAKGQKSPFYLGVLAQEVQQQFPEVVQESMGRLYVSHSEFVPVFVEAIKEQQTELEQISADLDAIEQQLADEE